MALPPRYSLYLLDADGPLIYSVEAVWGATNRVLEHYDIAALNLETWRQVNKAPHGRMYEHLGVPTKNISEALRLFQNFAQELTHTTTSIEVEETLKLLGKRKLAVVTDMPKADWESYSTRFGFGDYISVAITRDDCPERKPSSLPLFQAMEELGIQQKVIRDHKRSPRIKGLAIGDTTADITAGRNAGLDTAALFYKGSYNNEEKLSKKEPTYLIPNLDVIIDRRELKNYQINPSIFEKRRRR